MIPEEVDQLLALRPDSLHVADEIAVVRRPVRLDDLGQGSTKRRAPSGLWQFFAYSSMIMQAISCVEEKAEHRPGTMLASYDSRSAEGTRDMTRPMAFAADILDRIRVSEPTTSTSPFIMAPSTSWECVGMGTSLTRVDFLRRFVGSFEDVGRGPPAAARQHRTRHAICAPRRLLKQGRVHGDGGGATRQWGGG